MSPDELRRRANAKNLPACLAALWHDARGEWDQAHELCQRAGNRDGDWVHAYLHRKEDDLANAAYWYARAQRPMPADTLPLDAEWAALVESLSEQAEVD